MERKYWDVMNNIQKLLVLLYMLQQSELDISYKNLSEYVEKKGINKRVCNKILHSLKNLGEVETYIKKKENKYSLFVKLTPKGKETAKSLLEILEKD